MQEKIIALARKELRHTEIALNMARRRPNVPQSELDHLEDLLMTRRELLHILEKRLPKKPFKEGIADFRCASCRSYIIFDGLNGNIERAPKCCSECGQKIDWSDERTRNGRKDSMV